jgi:hypothetical protein
MSAKSVVASLLLVSGVLCASQGNRVVNQGTAKKIEEIDVDVVNYPLPLARLGEMLEQALGLGISYEDAPWVYPGDLVPARTHPGFRDFRRKNPWVGAHLPRGGSLAMKFSVRVDNYVPIAAPEKILIDALDRYRRNNGDDAEFRLLGLGPDGFAFVPVRHRDKSGQMVDVRSPLESRISFARKKMTGEEALEVILKAASKATLKDIKRVPHPFYPHYSATIGANNEIARDVLLRLVHELQPSDPSDTAGRMRRIAWQLNYAPDAEIYWFDWRLVMKVTPSPGGQGTLFAPVEIPRPNE